MCTVSIIPIKNKLVFTFNRDEHFKRQTPDFFVSKRVNNKTIYFTKDTVAGGSWFTFDEDGNVALLFNGGLEKHTKKANYVKSRGLILLDLIAASNCLTFFKNYTLQNIEPFSIILFFEKKLYRLIWDGEEKEVLLLNSITPYIFSSATLYTKNVQQEREKWLNQFVRKTDLTLDNIFDFHLTTSKEDKENGLQIERANGIHTLSISQIALKNSGICIKHLDIKTNKVLTKNLTYNVAIV